MNLKAYHKLGAELVRHSGGAEMRALFESFNLPPEVDPATIYRISKPLTRILQTIDVCPKALPDLFFGYLHFNGPVDETEDALKIAGFQVSHLDGRGAAVYMCLKDGRFFKYTPGKPEEDSFYKIILNTMCYIHNHKEPFSSQFCEFKSKESGKRVTKTYEIKELGYENVYMRYKDSCSVSGHFRWQRCGVGRKDVKLTYVKPHLRVLKGGKE